MEAQVEMQELFVTTKVNKTALVYGTCFMQVFLKFLIFLSVSSIIGLSELFEDRDEKLG